MQYLSQDVYGALIVVTLLGFLNGSALCLAFAYFPTLRGSSTTRGLALVYSAASLGIFYLLAPAELADTALGYWCLLFVGTGHLPVVCYVLSTAVASAVHWFVMRALPDRETARLRVWHRRLLRATRLGQGRLLETKLKELERRRTDPTLRRELIELCTKMGEYDHALYHAYSLVGLLPRGHPHGLALYRLCQILVDQLGRLDAAQPYLRRILRTYPRSYFASYARRLINHYEAYADREA